MVVRERDAHRNFEFVVLLHRACLLPTSAFPSCPPPNHALQRTEAGGRLFSAYSCSFSPCLSLSLSPLGHFRTHATRHTAKHGAGQPLIGLLPTTATDPSFGRRGYYQDEPFVCSRTVRASAARHGPPARSFPAEVRWFERLPWQCVRPTRSVGSFLPSAGASAPGRGTLPSSSGGQSGSQAPPGLTTRSSERGRGGRRFSAFRALLRPYPSLSLEALGALPLCFVCGGTSVSVRFMAASVPVRSVVGVLPSGGSPLLRSAIPGGSARHSPAGGKSVLRSPDSEFHAPNNALQRTGTGGRLFSVLHALTSPVPVAELGSVRRCLASSIVNPSPINTDSFDEFVAHCPSRVFVSCSARIR